MNFRKNKCHSISEQADNARRQKKLGSTLAQVGGADHYKIAKD
jgi:hypothetical protein